MTINDVVVLPFGGQILKKTAMNAIRKYSHTSTSMMYNRTPVELLDNIFMGDLAKNALLEWLKPRCNSNITDYDEVRTDNFKEPDPGWDFIAGNKQLKAEVKSSIPTHNENYNRIITLRDIKITASHDKGLTWIDPKTLESDIHIQIYFYAKPWKNGYSNFDNLAHDLNTNPGLIHSVINTKKYSEPLFFGWNIKKNIIAYSEKLDNPTWSFDKTSRIYWKCPIKEAFNLSQLVKYINRE